MPKDTIDLLKVAADADPTTESASEPEETAARMFPEGFAATGPNVPMVNAGAVQSIKVDADEPAEEA